MNISLTIQRGQNFRYKNGSWSGGNFSHYVGYESLSHRVERYAFTVPKSYVEDDTEKPVINTEQITFSF
jgi:hypothetical protein